MSNQIKYSHRRLRDENGEILIKGGVTYAYIEGDYFLIAGKAVCSEKDNFCKKTGRKLALRRLQMIFDSINSQ